MTATNESAKISRREALQRGLLGAAGLTLLGHDATSAAVQPAHAKAVIQIWMWGGPCHIDTFDPKPDAGREYTGPLNNAIPTNVDGIQIGELLPLLAQQADKYSIIRSMTHGVNAHETASYLVQTGRMPGRLVYPSVGAVVSAFKGYDHGYDGVVPPYIVLTESQGRFSEAGFLGYRYKPFATGGDPNQKQFVVEGVITEGVSDDRQQRRRELLRSLDSLGQVLPDNPRFSQFNIATDAAYNLMFGDARRMFDLSSETEDAREQYGRNTFGQCCLMARRLVEAGVPFVTINYKGWDTHKQHFEIMRRKLPEMDKAMATLLQDLSGRGLLDSTIVWWSGEFGRTPKVLWESPWNGGRSHYGKCFCAVVAGGGFKGGHLVGASDVRGEEVAERPVYPADLISTMYTLLGIDPEGPLPNPRNLDVKVLPADEEGGLRSGLLTEIT